jgi:diguanylate cyclase (GGDEF)-like protein/PAS domain S-box-containing protein
MTSSFLNRAGQTMEAPARASGEATETMSGVHASHRQGMRRIGALLLLLALIQFTAWAIPATQGSKGIAYYLPLHTLMEIVSIVIAMMVFGVGWNSHTGKTAGNLVLLACLFFAIGWLDFSHTAAYGGMPDFVTPNDSDKHLYFWISARLLAASSLLVVSLRPWEQGIRNASKYAVIAALMLGVAALNWVVICHQGALPELFIPGQGLTPLKKGLEYLCIAMNLVTLVLLRHKMRGPQAFNAPLLFAAAAVMAMSEVFFTLYTTMTGAYNVLGHIYKVISYLIIYRAVVVESIERPYLQLTRARKNLALAVEASTTGMVMVDERGLITLTNAQTDAMFGYAKGELLGMSADELIPMAQRAQYAEVVRAYLQHPVERHIDAGRELYGRHKLGHAFRVEIGLTPIDDDEGRYVIASVTDITSRVENERRIEQLINFDALTGLPNRNLLHDRMGQAIRTAERTQAPLAMLFLDLDHFKNVNDTLGHSMGDELLVEVGQRLTASIRQSDTVARIGGDEFVLVLADADATNAEAVSKKLLECLARPYQIGAHTLASTPSIGIALYPQDGTSFGVLYQHADAAMYMAKKDGRNGYRFYTAETQAHTERMLTLEGAMGQALELNQFYLDYQPQLSVDGLQVTGVEALLRWQHPQLGRVSPAEFVPLAETNGQIIPIGTWVLRTAVRQLRAWLDAGLPPMVMAVNLSAVQFRHANLPALVTDILQEARLPAECLELELTEGVTMGNPQSAIATMDDLFARGVRMSIDDFGTGYSSLNYLKKFKVYKLKIDQSFVRDIASDPDDRAIVSTIIKMAHSVGFIAIAEGVETPEQHAFLVAQGCDEVQGYFFSKPLHADDVVAFINGVRS